MEQKTEQKNANTHLKAILKSPAIQTVPSIPEWTSQFGTTSVPKNPSAITIAIPSSASDDPHANLFIHNCVATIDLGCPLDLRTIHFRTRNSEYNPARFNGIVMRILVPRTTALIFSTGKIIITGARNESNALLSAKKFAKIIQKLNFNIKFASFKIHNIVATCDLKFPIKLENLYQLHGQFSRYEPELFAGLIYRMIKPRLVLLIFVNGKVVITGAKTRQEIREAMDNIYPILKSFRKK